MPTYRPRIDNPPSAITGPLAIYLGNIAAAVNAIPHMSYFSATTPNSRVTGQSGHLAINLASGSTDSRVWVMGGDTGSGQTTLGWVPLRTGTP